MHSSCQITQSLNKTDGRVFCLGQFLTKNIHCGSQDKHNHQKKRYGMAKNSIVCVISNTYLKKKICENEQATQEWFIFVKAMTFITFFLFFHRSGDHKAVPIRPD